jgi:phosphoglycolate phosphatase
LTRLRQGFGGQGALVLFDIDGTLLLSGGAGVRAMTIAFEEVFGVARGFETIAIAGFTDSFLLSRALTRAGLPDTPETHARFRERYLEILPEEIEKPGTGHKGLMPGVAELLDDLSRRDDVHAALLTGNYSQAARLKLTHFGVEGFFSWGAFGEDSPDRGELARLVLQRAEERAIPRAARDNAVVIGDTPHDIACARVIGARVIAVATGGYSVEQLQASGPDTVVPDLSDTAAILKQLTTSN